MKYIKYIVLIILLTTLNCSLKKPASNKEENIELMPGEEKLFKDRDNQFELYTWNKTQNGVTFYIEAIGDVWGYDDSHDENPNIGDSLAYDTVVTYYRTYPDIRDYGFDHLATETTEGHYYCHSIYKIGVIGDDDWMRVSWIDDRYYFDNYPRFDTWAIWDQGLKIGYETDGGFYEEYSSGKTYHIWKYLKEDNSTSVDIFEGNLSKITTVTIAGPDSLPSQQSDDFTATHNGRDNVFLEYKWWLKVADGSYQHQSNWDNDSTISHSSSQSFTLKCEIWDLVHDVKEDDTHQVAVGPITAVDVSGDVELDANEEGEFTANVTPSHRDTYYIDYDWWVWYLEEPPKGEKKEEQLRLPPTGEWIKLSAWDGYQDIKLSSSYYSFKLKSIA